MSGSRSVRIAAVAAMLTVTGWTFPNPASATGPDVTRAEAISLIEAARTDRGARQELRLVETIDGQPVHLDTILTGPAAVQRERLDDLLSIWGQVEGNTTAAVPSDEANDAARDAAGKILEDDRFHDRSVPKPFRGVLRRFGDRLSAVWDPIANVLTPVLGTTGTALFVLGGFAAMVAVVATRLVGARSRAAVRAAEKERCLVDLTDDPDDLERRSSRAAADGDHSLAVRLRYEAGLIRLVNQERLVVKVDTTARGAAEQLEDPDFDDLTTTFEGVVYGGRVASQADYERSLTRWRRVLEHRSVEVRRR